MKFEFFKAGIKDGIPIGCGYFAVAFSLGIVAKKAGLTPIEGFFASLLNLASAGENALFSAIKNNATYLEVAVATFIINARYFLMSASLSQRMGVGTPFYHRFFVGYGITDEIFGISIAQKGFLEPSYNYGAILMSAPFWSIGTALGICAGTYLPTQIVNALSVALYGMFIAIIVPPCKKSLVILIAVLVSFLLSYICSVLPVIKDISEGSRTVILTILISFVCAVLKPVEDKE